MPPSPRGERSHRKTDAERLRLFNLSRQLRTNLQYAKLKVERGWTKQSLPEVENLYFHYRSKGREPSQVHRASTSKPRGGTKGQSRVPHPTQDVASTPMATVADVLASITPGQSSPAMPQPGATDAAAVRRAAQRSLLSGDVDMSSQGDADAEGEVDEDDPLATPTAARPTTPTPHRSVPGSDVLPFQTVTALASPASILPSRTLYSAPQVTTSLASTSGSPAGNTYMIQSLELSRIPPAVVASFAAQQGYQPSQVQAMLAALAASGQLAQATSSGAPGRPATSTSGVSGAIGDNTQMAAVGARTKGSAAASSRASTSKPGNASGLGSPLNVGSASKTGAGSGKPPLGSGGGGSLTYETFWQNHTADTKKYESLLNHPNPALAAAAASFLKTSGTPPSAPAGPASLASHTSPGPGAGQDLALRAARLGVSRRPSPAPDSASMNGDGEQGSRARSRTSVRSTAV